MKFSIIMPVYNAEATLAAALDSLLGESFADWELVCVDDGSTDGSGAILSEYSARDRRIRVITQKNGGASFARNRALSEMRGEYFFFLDADDILFSGSLAALAEILERTGADALETNPLFENFTGTLAPDVRTRLSTGSPRVIESARRKELLLDMRIPKGYLAGRVYRTEIFGHLRFTPLLVMMEDNVFWSEAIALPAKWVIARGAYYGYRIRSESVSHKRDATFYYDTLVAPRLIASHTTEALSLTLDEERRFWHYFSGIYAGILRAFFIDLKDFPEEIRSELVLEFNRFRRAFRFDPLPRLTALRAWLFFHGLGTGAWVDRIERPLTRAMNALRSLKRRLGR